VNYIAYLHIPSSAVQLQPPLCISENTLDSCALHVLDKCCQAPTTLYFETMKDDTKLTIDLMSSTPSSVQQCPQATCDSKEQKGMSCKQG
jgi:hypothetical protein